MNVLIADDHAIVREGLKRILADLPGEVVIGEAANGVETCQLVRNRNWDVVLLDINMPGRNGLDTLKVIKDEKPELPVLVLSIYPEDQYALRALKANASGYLAKNSAPELLISAIAKVTQGGKYISETVAQKLAGALSSDVEKLPHETLSDREYEILRAIASGHTLSQIADHLSLSVKTIGTYRSRILQKMKLTNNAELTVYAIKNGLVD